MSDGRARRAGGAGGLRLPGLNSTGTPASPRLPSFAGRAAPEAAMDSGGPAGSHLIASNEPALPVAATRDSSQGRTGPGPAGPGGGARSGGGRPAAANAARERSRVQTLRHAFLELQRTLPSVPPDTKLSKLDVLLLATTYIAHLTRSLQDDADAPADPGLGALRGDGYLHPVKVGGQGALRSRGREHGTLTAGSAPAWADTAQFSPLLQGEAGNRSGERPWPAKAPVARSPLHKAAP